MRWSTVSHRHTGQEGHRREASPATWRLRRFLLPGCGVQQFTCVCFEVLLNRLTEGLHLRRDARP